MPSLIFTTSGTFDLVVAPGVIKFSAAAAEGAGASGAANVAGGSLASGPGSGAGGIDEDTNVSVTPGETLTVIVASTAQANLGLGDSSLSRGVVNLLVGSGGLQSANGTSGGLGGNGQLGTKRLAGGNGGDGDILGGGGGGGGRTDGTNPGGDGSPGAGGIGGAGGNVGQTGGAGGDAGLDGLPGTSFGTGGGGAGGDLAVAHVGGDGGGGDVSVNWETPPVVASCVPAIGPQVGGTPIQVLGSDFVNGATVDFGAGPLAAAFVNSGRLDITTPPSPPGFKTVSVINPSGNFGRKTNGFMFRATSADAGVGPSINRRRRR